MMKVRRTFSDLTQESNAGAGGAFRVPAAEQLGKQASAGPAGKTIADQ
jgi:hypothetical protein